MSELTIKGKVVSNLGVQKGTSKAGKEWSKTTLIAEYGDSQYPKRVALDNLKNAEEFAKLAVGTEGVFHIEVESREFNGRWYTSANCWKWETAQQPQQAPIQPAQQGWEQMYQQPQVQPQTPKDEMGDPLPF